MFEVDQPGPQAWKRQRLLELGFGVPDWLRLVPADFEVDGSWWPRLAAAGFDPGQPAVVASTGVTMYLTRDATAATLRQVAGLASGTPFISFYTPPEMLALAREAGFRDVRHVPGSSLAGRYFAGRADGLRPSSGEDLLVATT